MSPFEPPRHILYPGALFAHREEHLVSTILGSCVSVCLWDPQLQCGGINHYMLPLWNGEGLPTPKYGNIAIEKLIEKMQALGCVKENLRATIFGGANVLLNGPDLYHVGSRNIAIANELLARHKILLKGSKVGGDSGMRIHFNTRAGSVFVNQVT